ncbi:cyclin-like protein [Diplogelasinospora grovesii]|uniref:Cyclin-like protein n=1 Tax=Diplogelasinospora grovesii TaxID=303347 RepID=A0AAN6NCS5_9PEZI|nr:cyclin-like protein [Diplogelasinospora grovesii]
MPVQRAKNPRLVSNENDENSSSTRVTRANSKAAALGVDELAMPSKGLQSKKTGATANPARKRAALGDVSNVAKVESVAEGKKPLGAKAGLVSKAAQPTGIQKKTTTTTTATRTALATKEVNKKVETKRSGSGAIGVQKRKVSGSSSSATIKEETPEEGEPLRKKVHTLEAEKKIKSDVKHEEPPRKESVPPAPEVEEDIEPALPPEVLVLESEDNDDPLMVAEYANEIFEYLRDLECKSVPNPGYMSHQDELEWNTRGILIDWLIEVHTRFHLLPETLFLAVNIIDRFLSAKVVQLDRLQLVGITAMFIASKYEEVLSPHISNFVHVADDGFKESEILSAERFVLSVLNYDLSYPNPMNFLRRISKADSYDIQSRTMGKYLMEISLLDHRFMAHRPSHVAAAAMYLARMILDRGHWDATLEYYAGYTEEEIEPVVHLMIDYLARPIVHEAFFKKYASKKFLKASILTRQWAKKNWRHFGIENPELSLDQIS